MDAGEPEAGALRTAARVRRARRRDYWRRGVRTSRVLAAWMPPALLVSVVATAGVARAAPAFFEGVVLEDPRGKEWPLGALRGHATLLVIADRAASDDALAWGKGAGEARLDDVAHWAAPGKLTVVSVLDLRGIPEIARGTARWLILRMLDEQKLAGPPRLMDWDGVIVTPAGAEEGVATVRLYAPDGTLVHADGGAPTPEKLARLLAAIDGVLAGLAPPQASPAASATGAGPTPAE